MKLIVFENVSSLKISIILFSKNIAIRYNLETEWKNSFPHLREMDREELFEKARNNILDDLISLNGISSTVWEKNIHYELWNKLKDYIFTKIIEPSQHIDDIG